MSPLIKISNAHCRIGARRALRIDHFAIAPGEHWCLFGANGAGKSLTAALIAGRRVESAACVEYMDGFEPARDVHVVSFEEQQRLWRRDNRFDISDYSIDARDAGTLVGELTASSRAAEHQDATLLATLRTELGLESLLDKGIRFLSSGQLRRVLIARALYAWRPGVPQLLILDDPLESIDRDSRQRISHCIDAHLHGDCGSLLLCRRVDAIPAGISHLAIMQALQMTGRGRKDAMMASPAFQAMGQVKPRLPPSLPPAPAVQPVDPDVACIRLENVNAAYGGLQVLTNVNWIMDADRHVLIEGPNGCGKSTLLSLIDGENHQAWGQQVYLFGQRKGSGETVWETKAKFGLVSNELHNRYVKGWKVLDVVVSGFFDSVGLYDDSGASEAGLAKQWLQALGIGELERHPYHGISFGQQRLVLLARAMVKRPRVLILDEPCVGLDDYHRRLILALLDLIAATTDTRIIYVSHVVGEQPECINQKLVLVPAPGGACTLREEKVDGRTPTGSLQSTRDRDRLA